MDERKQRVLIVEDETDIQQLIACFLTNNGYDCVTAENGQDALKKWKRIHMT